MREMRLTYPRQLYELWKEGKVHDAWFWEHEGLFDDIHFAYTQGDQGRDGYHFGESFMAIFLSRRGYRVFTSTCFYPKNRKRFKETETLLGRDAFSFFYNSEKVYPPDLLVFDPKLNLVFFVEVKRDRDTLKRKQQRFFRKIETKFGFPVLIARLQPR